MKINLGTVEMNDEERTRLADVLDEKVSKRKASRVEAKDYILTHGNAWPIVLSDEHGDLTGEGSTEEPEDEESDEDLLGSTPTSSESDLDDLL